MSARHRGLARVRPSARIVVGALTLLVVGCAAAAPLRAEPVTSASPTAHAARGVVLLVRTPRHLVAALDTADTLRASDAARAAPRPVHVIACGDAIEAVLRDAATEPRVRAAVARGFVVTACGMSLEEKGLDAARLSTAVTLVPNGLIEAIRLQEAGFVSIEL